MRGLIPAMALGIVLIVLTPSMMAAESTYKWGYDEKIGMWETKFSDDASIVMYPNGEAVAVWMEDDSFLGKQLYWNHYSSETGWIGANILYYQQMGDHIENTLSLDEASGNILLTWINHNNSGYAVWASLFKYPYGWDAPVMVYNSSVRLGGIVADIGAGGQAGIVFAQESDTYEYELLGRYFDGSSWSSNDWIGIMDIHPLWPQSLIVDQYGHAILSYLSINTHMPPGYDGYISWYDGSTWGTKNISVPGISIGGITMDALPSGQAIIAWMEVSGAFPNYVRIIRSMTYSPGGIFGVAVTVPIAENVERPPILKLLAQDRAVLLYAMGTKEYAAASILNGGTWSEPTVLDSDQSDTASFNLHLAVNSNGQAIAFWERDLPNDNNRMWSNCYTPGNGWGEAVRVQKTSTASRPSDIGMDSEGNAIALWFSVDGDANSLFASRWTVSDSEGYVTTQQMNDLWNVVWAAIGLAAVSMMIAVLSLVILMRKKKQG